MGIKLGDQTVGVALSRGQHGAYAVPLLGATIGHNLERTIARVPDAEAPVPCHEGLRYTYAEFGEAVDRLGLIRSCSSIEFCRSAAEVLIERPARLGGVPKQTDETHLVRAIGRLEDREVKTAAGLEFRGHITGVSVPSPRTSGVERFQIELERRQSGTPRMSPTI